jgi:hypothetical protein
MGGRGSAGAKGGAGGVQNWSLAKVGALASGNVPGLTVEQEYQMKEVNGQYTAQDRAVAAQYGQTPAQYQAHITADIAKKGILSPARVDEWTATRNGLSEGYHRYAAARKLGRKTMPVINTGHGS